jgi:hypothetical protein
MPFVSIVLHKTGASSYNFLNEIFNLEDLVLWFLINLIIWKVDLRFYGSHWYQTGTEDILSVKFLLSFL